MTTTATPHRVNALLYEQARACPCFTCPQRPTCQVECRRFQDYCQAANGKPPR